MRFRGTQVTVKPAVNDEGLRCQAVLLLSTKNEQVQCTKTLTSNDKDHVLALALWVPGKLPISYVLNGNLLSGKIQAMNITVKPFNLAALKVGDLARKIILAN